MDVRTPVPFRKIQPVHPFTVFDDAAIEQSLPERFEQQVHQHGDRLAIKSDKVVWTFDALNQVANRLAHWLLHSRGTPAEPIALLFDHGADVIAALLGVLKAGKFYVVLDASYPRQRLHSMLEDCAAQVIIADSQNLTLARELSHGALEIVDFAALDEHLPHGNPGVYPTPEQLAVLLYTSGSTGRPKGVMHTHRTILADVRNLTNDWCISMHDKWLLHTSMSFANSVRTIYGALMNGASLYPYDVKAKGFGALPNWLLTNGITIFRTIPTTFRHFMSTLSETQTFPTVRLLVVGGEPMFNRDLHYFEQHFLPHCMLVHPLGPTECLTVCWSCIPHGMHIEDTKLPIGYPLRDKDVLLLDEERREVATGEVGEIAVRSRYISPGYWRDPERTHAAFFPDSLGDAQRIYLTGDLGLRLPGGCLVHIGREDFQVKIRGFRIDVSEIEMALLTIDGIQEAIVVSREDARGEQRLVAYFASKRQPALSVSQIRQHLRHVLPEYMMPSAFVSLDALPKLPNGKTDRRMLPPPPDERPVLETAFVAPETATDIELARIWSEVLGCAQVGIHDNFFDLGGNSLLATRMTARVMQTFRLELPLKVVFESPTVAALGTMIMQEQLRTLGAEEITSLIAELESLSEDDLKRRLA
jgi:amino acid adenylation domain-containing protein